MVDTNPDPMMIAKVMSEHDTSYTTARRALERVHTRWNAFYEGYVAAIEDVIDGDFPNVAEGDDPVDHVMERQMDMYEEFHGSSDDE